MNKGDDKKQKPKEDKDFTSVFGIVTVVLIMIYFAFALLTICYFYDRGQIYSALKSSDEFDKFVGIAKDIGLLAVGVIGLPFAIWRSMIADGQRTAALEQLKRTDAQLRETENNNVAKLLVDGTKLLNNDTTKAEKIAGVVCLANIIMGESKFQQQATTVLNTFVEGVVSDYISGETQLIITDAKVRRKYFPIKSKNCEVYNSLNALSQYTNKDKSKGAFFFKNIRIEGLTLRGQDYPRWIFDLLYFKCAFENAYIGINAEYIRSTFYQCEIGSLGGSAFVCIFRYCIFNSCNIWTKIPSEWGERFKNCVYNDKYVTDDQSRKFFESIGIPPLSSLTAEKRRKFGPQKTT